MKKSKLSFFIVSALLAITSLAGCNNAATNSDSKAGDNSSITNSDSSQGGETNSSDNSQGASSSGGASNSSQGGNSNSSQGGTSQNSSSSSDGGQGSQTDKTDWTNDEKQAMRTYLHGEVLPFVNLDATVRVDAEDRTISVTGTANSMPGDFLFNYLQAFYELDNGWEGRDVSGDYGAPFGSFYQVKKAIQENDGKTYYVVVSFAGAIFDAATETLTYTPTGKFYLEALDPYLYEYPATFIGQWLQGMYGTTIVPPDMHADYYMLDAVGVLVAYSETNLEDAYKQALLATEQFTVDANKDNADYIVAHPTDGTYTLKFKYDASEKVMIMMVEGSTGWNTKTVSDFFAKNNQPVVNFPPLNIEGATYRFTESSDSGYTSGSYMIMGANVTLATLTNYVEACREAGFVVNMYADETMYSLSTMLGEDNLYLANLMFSSMGSNGMIMITMPAAGLSGSGRLYQLPMEQFGTFLNGVEDELPMLQVRNAGYECRVNGNTLGLVIYSDTPGAEKAVSDYKALLLSNKFTASGDYYVSEHEKLKVGIYHEAQGSNDLIFLQVQKLTAPEPTAWPSADIANLLIKIGGGETITDTIPVLDVSNAKECYVSDTYSEIRIEGIGADFAATAKQALLDANFVENPYYYIDFNMTGALISPNKQFVVHIYVVNNDVMLMIKDYWAPEFKVVGLGGNWKYDESLVFFSDATKQDEVDKEWYVSQLKAEFDVNADDEFKVTDGGEWFGFSVLEANEKFSEGTNGNIKANEKGHVVLYLKSLTNGNKGIVIEFTPDEPELKPWPEQEILTFFGEDTFAVIPEIKIADASYEVIDKFDEDGVKCIAIMVTVAEAPSKMATAIQELKNQFSYSYDEELEGYVSSNEGFPVYAFTANDDNSFFVSIAYFAPAEEPDFKVVGLDDNWNYDDGREFEEADDIPEGYLAQYTALFHVDRGEEFKVTNGTLWLGADELVANEKFGSGEGSNIVAKESGEVALTFSILENGEKQISIIFTADEEQPTTLTYKLVSRDNWDNLVDSDAKFFAWVWGGSYGDGEWIELEIDEENHCFYLADIDVNATGFKIVRMAPDAEPDFDAAWNQTANDQSFPELGLKIYFSIL